ncbi:ras-related protein Rab-7L1-like [Amphiura filiformis]|uniref:ras-related protein Rab-7L1-like n=1 Tax=Amphiura filiformis TaxID=82378 RepID=UPI003B216D6A
MAAGDSFKQEKLFKVLVVGDSLVGKTAFVRRYVQGRYEDNYKVTVGVDFALKKIQRSEDEVIRLQLWDIAGQERFSSLTRVYYKDASACVIMFDVTQNKTFQSVIRWKDDVDSKVALRDGTPIPCLLLANKVDLPEHSVTEEEIKKLSQDRTFVGWSMISVKDNVNVADSMKFLVEEILVRTRAQGTKAGELTDSDGRIKLPLEHNKEDKSCCF